MKNPEIKKAVQKHTDEALNQIGRTLSSISTSGIAAAVAALTTGALFLNYEEQLKNEKIHQTEQDRLLGAALDKAAQKPKAAEGRI